MNALQRQPWDAIDCVDDAPKGPLRAYRQVIQRYKPGPGGEADPSANPALMISTGELHAPLAPSGSAAMRL
jgi:hypothetical protein